MEAKLPNINREQLSNKVNEILKAHASYKELSPMLMGRILNNYIEELDPTKTYFIESDIKEWIDPSPELLQTALKEFKDQNFEIFGKIDDKMILAIQRHRKFDAEMKVEDLPQKGKF